MVDLNLSKCVFRILQQYCLKICLYRCENKQGRIYLQIEEILVFFMQTTFKSVYCILNANDFSYPSISSRYS